MIRDFTNEKAPIFYSRNRERQLVMRQGKRKRVEFNFGKVSTRRERLVEKKWKGGDKWDCCSVYQIKKYKGPECELRRLMYSLSVSHAIHGIKLNYLRRIYLLD